VATASGNPILAAIVEMVCALFYELRRGTAGRVRDLRPIADTHRQIYQAIREHTPARAASLMGDHLILAEQEQECEERTDGRPTGTAE
jgi:DNA-binding FadR family transcriptional regulator